MNDAHLLRPGWRERWHEVNGITLHTVEAGQAGDPLLLLLHGFPEFWWAWRKLLTPLAEAGYHVVAPDMRGYNRSTAPAHASAYALDILAADVIGLAEALGSGRFCLAAHDWGAVVGWWVATCHPAQVARAVLISGPHPDAWAGQMFRNLGQTLRSAYIGLFQLPKLPEAALSASGFAWLKSALRRSAGEDAFEFGALDHYAKAWAQPGALTGMLNYYRALRRRGGDRTPARVEPPMQIIWGDEDRFLGREVMEASAALCGDGRLVVLEGGTHWLHLEQPARMAAEIVGFLGRTS